MAQKILLINTEVKTASTGKITFQFYQEMKRRGYDVTVAFGAKNRDRNADFFCMTFPGERRLNRIWSEWTGRVTGGAWIATKRLIKYMDITKPDVVHLFNLHGYYVNEKMLFSYLKGRGIKIVYNMLDEYPYLGSCCYAYDCDQFYEQCKECYKEKSIYPVTKLFRCGNLEYKRKYAEYALYEKIVFTGPKWVIDRARKSGILRKQRLEVADEFVDVEKIFYPRNTQKLRKKLGILPGQVVFLNVAPLSNPRKGVMAYYKVAEQLKNTNYVFVHVGYNVPKIEPPENVIAVPFVSNQNELAEYYSVADLLVCTSIADTMPNVCLDALACGTPVCGFASAGIPYVAPEPLGRFVPMEDEKAFIRMLLQTLPKKDADVTACRKYAEERYSVKIFANKMEDIYEKYFDIEAAN